VATASLLAKLIREGVPESTAKRAAERAAAKQRAAESENAFFDKTTTDMPFYDDLIKSLEGDNYKRDYFREQKGLESAMTEMSPDEYMSLVDQEFSSDVMNGVDPAKVSDYAEKMRAGEQFPTLTLDYTRGKRLSQEGRHRALAAKQAGANSVPVLMVKPTLDEAKRLGVSLDDINKKLRPYLASATGSGVLGTAALAPQEAEAKIISSLQALREGEIKAPKNARTGQLAAAIRAGERAVKGSPAEFVYPSGLAPWLERIAYDEEPTKMETVMAIADFL